MISQIELVPARWAGFHFSIDQQNKLRSLLEQLIRFGACPGVLFMGHVTHSLELTGMRYW
ncbi:hypothetical protein WB44_01795 [Synechococcus sp. WH 8020]|nr:hypothetical protein WB44_01795 [Synechococcus sp. WH 8020]